MNIGDQVFHIPNQRVLTVRSLPGNNMVGCCWIGLDKAGKEMEFTSGFDWKELRTPTAEELAAEADRMAKLRGQTTAPAEASPGPRGDESAPEAAGAPAEHKRKRQ